MANIKNFEYKKWGFRISELGLEHFKLTKPEVGFEPLEDKQEGCILTLNY